MSGRDWTGEIKDRLKRSPRLAAAVLYLTDLLYIRTAERRRFLTALPPDGRRLNLGSGFRPSPPGFWGVDRQAFPSVRVVADLAALPFADGTVDGILCETVLEHVLDATGAIREMHRVLRPGGRVYLTIPFLWPYHGSPHDYRRWTVSGIAEEFACFETMSLELCGGPTTTLCNVLHEWLAIVLSFNVELLYRALYLALIPVVYPFKLLDYLFDRYRHAGKIGALYGYHGRKWPATSGSA